MLRNLLNGMVQGGAAIAAGAVGLKTYEEVVDRTDNTYLAAGCATCAGMATYQAVNLLGTAALNGAEDGAGMIGCKINDVKKNKKSKKDEEDED